MNILVTKRVLVNRERRIDGISYVGTGLPIKQGQVIMGPLSNYSNMEVNQRKVKSCTKACENHRGLKPRKACKEAIYIPCCSLSLQL